jgi:hypothetical protein
MLSITNILYTTCGLLTLNTLNGIILGTSQTIQNIYNLLPSSSNLTKYKDKIEELDIEFKLNIIQQWTDKQDTQDIKSDIIKGIGDICIKISDILDIINNKISYHNTKWLANYRNPDLDNDIIILTKYNNILNYRLFVINLI